MTIERIAIENREQWLARMQVENLEGQFKAALPAHIPTERFCRVLMTAIQNNPDLVILDEKDRAPAPKAQRPFFVRTTWLFAELEELSMPVEADIFAAIKVARLRVSIASIGPLLAQIEAYTPAICDGRRRHERGQLCTWIREQIARESTP